MPMGGLFGEPMVNVLEVNLVRRPNTANRSNRQSLSYIRPIR